MWEKNRCFIETLRTLHAVHLSIEHWHDEANYTAGATMPEWNRSRDAGSELTGQKLTLNPLGKPGTVFTLNPSTKSLPRCTTTGQGVFGLTKSSPFPTPFLSRSEKFSISSGPHWMPASTMRPSWRADRTPPRSREAGVPDLHLCSFRFGLCEENLPSAGATQRQASEDHRVGTALQG